MTVPLDGTCDPRFEAVRSALRENLTERGDIGAAVALVMGDRLVVDLWGGYRDQARTLPWAEDTLVCGFSLGKTLAAECVHVLVDRGRIEYDRPVAHYWPEFAAAGKADLRVRDLLCHRGGLPAVRRPLEPWAELDWELFTSALAEETPWWAPGERHGYHVGTYGHLVGELVRRVSGLSFGEFLRRELAGPLGLDIHCGSPPELDPRTAQIVRVHGDWQPRVTEERRELLDRVYNNTWTNAGVRGQGEDIPANTRRWRAAQHPGNNMAVTARSVAAYAAMHARGGVAVDGRRFLSEEVVAESTREHARGIDFVLGVPTCFALGFKRWQRERTIGPHPDRSYFANGYGGSLAVVDPVARFGFAYVLNAPLPNSFLTERNVPLINAVYRSLGLPTPPSRRG